MRVYKWSQLNTAEQQNVLERPAQKVSGDVQSSVRHIMQQVREKGDAAVQQFTNQFDGVDIEQLKVSNAEFTRAATLLADDEKAAIEAAAQNIRAFHQAQQPQKIEVQTMPGVMCLRQSLPIEKVGLYVPGGNFPLPSTMLMLGVPATLAGCDVVVACVPPQKDGTIHPTILYAAQVAGVADVYKIGGAQAIAAMAFGTETVPSVDKIFGPGNAFVTEAKLQATQSAAGAAIDMPAGPSEQLLIADATSNPAFAAADLLSQLEHSTDAQAILVTDSENMLAAIQNEIDKQLLNLPETNRHIAKEALKSSAAIVVTNMDEAMIVSNAYAPEHLLLQMQNAQAMAQKVRHAGSVFVGQWTTESLGDYASGTNHTLPTYGFARAYSGTTLEAFMKTITFQNVTQEGLNNVGPIAEKLADMEDLQAHKNAVTIRLHAAQQEKAS